MKQYTIALSLLTLNEIKGCEADFSQIPFDAFDEVYAIDGGSTDGTVEFLTERGIAVYSQNIKGYNGAYLEAFNRAKSDFVVLFHPKGSIDPNALRQFRQYFDEGYHLVIASRMLKGAHNEEDEKLIKPRKWFVYFLSKICQLRWNKGEYGITDVLHGMRGMQRQAFFAIQPKKVGVTIDLEIVIRAYRSNLRAIEFPVWEKERLDGSSHFKAWPTGKKLVKCFCKELFQPFSPLEADDKTLQQKEQPAAELVEKI